MPRPEAPSQPWQWTSKLPAFIVGLLATLAAFWLLAYGKAPRATAIASVLILLAFGLFAYSSSVASWCTPPNRAFGSASWGQAFWHEPSLADCVRLTR